MKHGRLMRILFLCRNWKPATRFFLVIAVVTETAEYAPNVPGALISRHVLTPVDLERTYGLTEGKIFHGDLNLEQLFFMRACWWQQLRLGITLCAERVVILEAA
jgi:hypothetical protein